MFKLRTSIALAITASAVPASAQTITTLVQEGDVLPGVGNVTLINNLALNNSGQWVVEVDTDAATTADALLLKNGSVFMREGDVIPGATLSSFDDISLNGFGNFGGNLFLANTGGTGNDSGCFYNTSMSIQEGFVSTAPQFSANTPYIGFFGVKLDDNNLMTIMASVDDPLIATTVDRAIVKAQLNGSGGLVSETVLVKEGDTLPGHDQAAADFGTGPHNWAVNNAGQVLYVYDGAGDTLTDMAIYRDTTLIAREGSLSPVAARNWNSLSGSRLDLNSAGDHVYTGTLTGDTLTDAIIIKNGAKFMQEGDTLPAIGGVFTFTSFGTGPVELDDIGGVLWFGDWNDPDTTRDTGLFYNNQLLVQEGVTQIGGITVLTLSGVQDGYHLSENGQFVIFEATLTGGINGAYMIAIPEPGSVGLAAAGVLAVLARRRR
jgi:hypothetical protein